MKEKVLELRREGKSVNVIQKITGLSKSTVSKYCKDNGLGGRADGKVRLSDDKVKEINEYYQTHTRQETADFFNMSPHSVKYYVEKKVTLLTDEERIRNNYLHVKSFRRRNKERAVEYKGGECVKCGYKKCIIALEFHHLDPEKKDFTPSSNMNMSWDKIKEELDKCILLCSNCHRELHYGLFGT
jgi:predicted transcriptional regulator